VLPRYVERILAVDERAKFTPVYQGGKELQFHPITADPRKGHKVFTLQTLPASPDEPRREVAEASGFSLHAGIAAKASQREKLEHLARYVSRPPVAAERMSLTEGGYSCSFRIETIFSSE
jgi:hypothetical protein